MPNVTITRPNGETEQIALTDTQEQGYEYFPFLCSDGKVRYALLGDKSADNASHFWCEINGVRKYALKSPVTIPAGTFGKTLNAWDMNASDSFTATVPDKITVLKAVITLGNNATQEKYVGVTPGKTYQIDLKNSSTNDSAGGVSWYVWASVLGHYVDANTTTPYFQAADAGTGNSTASAEKFAYSATFTYSAAINTHAVDIQDY